MHLEHSFSVAAGVEQTWHAMLDPERMAGCIPGAALDSVKNGVANGAIRVRLGAVGPTYRGTAKVVEKDDDGHRAVVEARGDTRSFGDASVRLVVTVSQFGATTNVVLRSDVTLTGRAAEIDEQLISESGDRLCRQVAARLNDLLSTPIRRPAVVAEPAVADAPVPPETDAADSAPPSAPVFETGDAVSPSPPAAHPPSVLRRVAPFVVVLAMLVILRRRRRRRR
ncbi:MAG TPA: SRPBCC domain-containing protein [Jatrophihabitantaceae bacterium]|jgi:carbon monoxide dehydrogenase subunit G|nr:SRPBCC domain-containing protein [Jatrophihabitantaceae bacterium]